MTKEIQTRKTRQKEAIRAAFLEADRPLSPDEALALAQRRADALSLGTVYRNISSLVDDKWLTTVQVPGCPARYEVAGKAHHHHFQCRRCGAVHELEGCDVPRKPHLPRGFKYLDHDFFVYDFPHVITG
ncbi:Fur family transcriptional regulator [Edaphobacter modestus]|uniref:Fur family ferric uptake transcriptional regulator n=1 Tax=Edaphobacter modestus TaxID=388466 RepID=A0A4Q7YDU9_9BACT|nr:transcriptional repressor [Edaphobacter modestus]RZU35487.1 Fur family ferric uptake transcriptional regulator [Edaphobacter modestus]